MTSNKTWRWIALAGVSLSCLSLLPVATRSGEDVPPELGLVRWGRDFKGATSQAASSKKPILLLFQEIPG